MARLNPRDCWYWLSGNCLNPSCAFRHPPLEAHSGAPSESAVLPHQFSVPLNKTNVPCYFYFNGFCNKGEKCTFLHDPDRGTTAGKSSKAASAVTDALSLEDRTFTGSDKLSEPSEAHLVPSESDLNVAMDMKFQPKGVLQQLAAPDKSDLNVAMDMKFQPKGVLQQLAAPDNVLERSTSPHISVPECEEVALVGSDSLLPAEGFPQRSHILAVQSSEDQVDDHIEPEERWESSPGFDVLVDDKSEDLSSDNDPEYLPALDREQRERNNHFLGYDFEDPVEYDPMYPDIELCYECKIYDSCDHLDNEHNFDYVRKIPHHSRERMLDSILSKKRKVLPMELTVHDRSGMDLWDHLRKRRVIDGCPVSRLSRRHFSSPLNGQRQEGPRRHGMGRRLCGRLASEVGKNASTSLGANRTLSNSVDQQGWHRHPHLSQSRQRCKEKRLAKQQFLPPEVRRKSVLRERKSDQESTTFTGPKTLAQIKEEKKKAKENENFLGKMGHSGRTTSPDFHGPQPLSEILKDKRRLASERDDNSKSN